LLLDFALSFADGLRPVEPLDLELQMLPTHQFPPLLRRLRLLLLRLLLRLLLMLQEQVQLM
jgi:hypothetical protein